MTLPVTDFIVQRLLEYDSTFDVGAGVPTTGLLIEPLSVVLQPVIDELTLVQSSQSVLSVLESSDPDSFPEDIVDGIASNVYIERNPGSIGSDVMRLRFFSPTAFAAQQGVLIFRGSSSQRYTNSEAVSVTEAEMALNQDGSLYYADVPIVALEEGSDYNAAAGSITTMEAEPAGIANVTNRFGVEDGADRETNTELIDRIKVAVTVRSLVTGRGIIVSLTETFTTIEEIQPIGFGDPEMMRDIVYNVHIGGNVDVYVRVGSFSDGSVDVFNLAADSTRQLVGYSSIVALEESPTTYSLAHVPVDRTNVDPVVVTADRTSVFQEGTDYTLDDNTGLFSRLAGGNIYHIEAAGGTTAEVGGEVKRLNASGGAFSTVRRGMVLTVTSPVSVAGTYTIKTVVSSSAVDIFGVFPAVTAGVEFQVDDLLSVSYEYNPVTIDIIKEARSSGRESYTITDVPILYISLVEKLDAVSGNPTGETLSEIGGYGAGGYGEGGYGIGSAPDYRLVVEEPTLRFSDLEDNYLAFDSLLIGTAVRVSYKYISAIPPLQAYVDDRSNQTMAASLVVRNFVPILVDAPSAIQYEIPLASEATAISSDAMATLVKDFIDDIDEGDDLELSDLVDIMYDNGAVKVDLGTLEAMRGEIHHQDGTIEFVVPSSAGVMVIPDEEIPDPTDRPLSPRIARFIARDITLSRTSV